MANTTAPVSRPQRRLVLTLLALSVALNVFFVAGALWIRLHAPADQDVAAMRVHSEQMRQQVTPLIGAAWEAIGKPQADAPEIMRLFDAAAEKRREFQHEATAQTLAFLAVLTPAQRNKFVTIARERRAPGLRQHSPNR